MLAIQLEPDLEQRLSVLAKQQGRSENDVAQEAIRHYVFGDTLVAEAQRQSLLLADNTHEQSALDFIEQATDLEGWE